MTVGGTCHPAIQRRLRRVTMRRCDSTDRSAGSSRRRSLVFHWRGSRGSELAVEHPDRLGTLVVHGVEATFRPSIGSKIARRSARAVRCRGDSRFINQFFHLLFQDAGGAGHFWIS